VDAGLGKGVPLLGSAGLIAPTEEIRKTGTELDIDGVRFVFQCTPGTEAPAEMNFFFPERRILCMAENCTANLHNLYTPRGAQVRDALAWSKYLNESIELFAADTDTVFASHHWPRWGTHEVRSYLEKQRDLYRYLHDQSMRLANHGLTMLEIAEELKLPSELSDEFCNRDYYGTVNHNTKAVYQRYLGFFDGNPANLHPHTPVEAGRRYVAFMGGADALLRQARTSFEQGDYRWVAQVVNHLVFAEPDNGAARALQADALEQLGYQAESGPWRDFYLTAAQELRRGAPKLGGRPGVSADVIQAMSTEMLVDYLAVRLNGPTAAGQTIALTLKVTDRAEVHAIGIANGALHHTAGREAIGADATLSLAWSGLVALAHGTETLEQLDARGAVVIDGDRTAVEAFLSSLDRFEFWFPIVTP
jgi:alkyl sulfatase BDS1-like metallo-beta-lactamase superfamily hydrolase